MDVLRTFERGALPGRRRPCPRRPIPPEHLLALVAALLLAGEGTAQGTVRSDVFQAFTGFAPGLGAACEVREPARDPVLAEVSAALALPDRDEARRALSALEPGVREEAAASPGDLPAQYRLAAVLGARAEVEGGRTRVSVAGELATQVARVLALDPDHAGARYILGRLHAAVMRLDRLTRFVALRLLGGGALKSASWEAAREHLERAERADPCVPDHHYELARLYLDRNEHSEALRELGHVLELTAGREGRWAQAREKAERMRQRVGSE